MYVDANHHMITYDGLKIILKNMSLLYVVYITFVAHNCKIHITTTFLIITLQTTWNLLRLLCASTPNFKFQWLSSHSHQIDLNADFMQPQCSYFAFDTKIILTNAEYFSKTCYTYYAVHACMYFADDLLLHKTSGP